MKKQIEANRLKDLEKKERLLKAITDAKLVNWNWQHPLLKEINIEAAIEEIVEKTLTDIEVALLSGAYEPSERGAGYCSSDSGREEALDIFDNAIKEILKLYGH